MRSASIVLVGFMLLGSSMARAQEQSDLPEDYARPAAPAPEVAQPAGAEPAEPPPAPPLVPPPSPIETEDAYLAGEPYDDARAADSPGPSDGQWVYTEQYGWLFMPYGNQYVDEGDANDETPFAFVYYPGSGWVWVAAPWVWGWGAYPYFGALGANHFGWFRGLYAAGYGWGGYRGGHNHPHVIRLGGNGLLGGGSQSVAPAPTPGPDEAGHAGYHHGGFFGGYWGNYPLGGYVKGNGLVDDGAGRETAAPRPASGRGGGPRGGAHSSSGAAVGLGRSHGGASTDGRAGGSHGSGPAGAVVGASRGGTSAHHGGLTSGLRGGSSGGGKGSGDDPGRRR
jgi:hypothetical protein